MTLPSWTLPSILWNVYSTQACRACKMLSASPDFAIAHPSSAVVAHPPVLPFPTPASGGCWRQSHFLHFSSVGLRPVLLPLARPPVPLRLLGRTPIPPSFFGLAHPAVLSFPHAHQLRVAAPARFRPSRLTRLVRLTSIICPHALAAQCACEPAFFSNEHDPLRPNADRQTDN